MPKQLWMQLRRRKLYLATFNHGGETVDVPVRARSRAEAERQAKMLIADGWETTLAQVQRERSFARRRRSTIPTARERERRAFAVTLLAGALVTVAAVLLATQASAVGT